MEDIVVDARWLPPPEPMERILPALESLQPGQRLRFIIHREPFPLYEVLAQRGFTHQALAQPDGCFEIVIQQGATPS